MVRLAPLTITPMLTFLFWNLNKRSEFVAELVAEHNVDVLMLAESHLPADSLQKQLTQRTGQNYFADPQCSGVQIFVRFPLTKLRAELDEDGFAIRRLMLRPRNILLVVLHFPSKLWQSDDDQAALCPSYVKSIREVEQRSGHTRTLVVGDFNMNPYERGVVGATGFHAVPSRRVAARGERTVDRASYPFFYNPMWNCFGDERSGPPGTYFHDQAKVINPFWHMFDQVLLRPDLVPVFRHGDLRVLSQSGKFSLVDDHGRPHVSDHLPILFRLDLQPPIAP